jgi:hypothetical protein
LDIHKKIEVFVMQTEIHNTPPSKSSQAPFSSIGPDCFSECPDYSSFGSTAKDYRASYLSERSGSEPVETKASPTSNSEKNRHVEVTPASSGQKKGSREYMDTCASVALINDSLTTSSQVGCAGRLALGLVPLTVTAAGLVSVAAGSVTALASFGLMSLGRAAIDGEAYSIGIQGMCLGALAAIGGYGIKVLGDWGCHQVRRLFGDTEVSFREAMPKE